MKPDVQIKFSEKELTWINEVAARRNNPKLGVVTNRRYDNSRGDLEINIQGVTAEYAVASFLGIQIDERALLSGDDGHDLIYRGIKIQVKFNNTEYGDLYFNDLGKFKSECGVLVVPSEGLNRVRVVGWIDKTTFIQKWVRKDYGKGDRVAVVQGYLNDIYELKPWLDSGVDNPELLKRGIYSSQNTAVQAWAACGFKVPQERIDSHNAMIQEWQRREWSPIVPRETG